MLLQQVATSSTTPSYVIILNSESDCSRCAGGFGEFGVERCMYVCSVACCQIAKSPTQVVSLGDPQLLEKMKTGKK